MFDIWARLAELQQPCLYRRIGDRLIGADGLVRREILTSLDRLFCEHLAAGLASFQAPPAPPPIPAEHRFINVSALQKAIRRGDADGAVRFAQQGCSLNAEQVFRRLATIAIEDVGIGNLLAAGMALAVMGNKAMRENGAPDELAAYLAYQLAISSKSRLACDLLSIADYDRTLDPLKRRMAKAEPAGLASAASDRTAPLASRMIAGWLLAGSTRFRGTTIPMIARDRRHFMRLLVIERVPLMFYYTADRAAARLSDAMFVSMLPIAEMVAPDPSITISRTRLTDAPTIAGYPAAAFDLHTYEGRLAIGRFGREYMPVAKIVGALSPSMRDTAVRHAVFIAEGGRLAERVEFEGSKIVERQAHAAELAFAGIMHEEQKDRLLHEILYGMPTLHQMRAELGKRL